MRNYYFMYYKPNFLVPLILILGSAIGVILTWTIGKISSWTGFSYFQYPTAASVVGLFFYLITE